MGSSIKGRQVGSFVQSLDEDYQLNIVDERAQNLQSFQVKLLSELDEELKILAGEVAESCTYCMLLLDELSQYMRSGNEVVTCGLTAVSKEDAIDRTQKLVNNSRLRIVNLNQQIAAIEEERAALIAFEQEEKAEKASVALDLVSAVTVLVGAYS
jgi:hypothetical protein